MRKIIQIDESEYNKLVEKARLNEKQIEEKALKLYEEKGMAQIEIIVRTDSDCYSTRYFKCESSVWYKDSRFFISEKLRNRLGRFISEYVQYKINQDYQTPEELMSYYTKQLKMLNYARYIFYCVAMSGWAAFVTLLCMK